MKITLLTYDQTKNASGITHNIINGIIDMTDWYYDFNEDAAIPRWYDRWLMRYYTFKWSIILFFKKLFRKN